MIIEAITGLVCYFYAQTYQAMAIPVIVHKICCGPKTNVFEYLELCRYCQAVFTYFFFTSLFRVAGHPLAQNEKCLHMFLQEPVIDKNYVPGKIRTT